MPKYLDNNGLLYFWQKCKAAFAAISHTHSASDITSGVLGVGQGGTGVSTLGAGVVYHSANGTGALSIATGTNLVSAIGSNAVARATADASGNNIADTYAKKNDVTNMYKYKGSVATESQLPTTGQTNGDVYNIEAASTYGSAGTNVAWTGTEWDSLGGGSIATPVSVANGGTGATTAEAARAALGIYMGNGEVLYDNPSHNPGDGMRLSAPYTDYDYLVVVCKDNDGAICQPTIIPNPTLGTVFNVMSTYVGSSNGYFYFKVTAFELTANNGVNDGIGWPKDGNNWRTGQMTIGNSGNSWSYSFNIAPILVVGYKS